MPLLVPLFAQKHRIWVTWGGKILLGKLLEKNFYVGFESEIGCGRLDLV